MKKIGGKAKAMVVTSSRPQLTRYKAEFDHYIEEKGYNIETLVAFSPFTDPNKLYDDKYQLETYHVIRPEDIEGFVAVYFKTTRKMGNKDHALLEDYIRSALDRYRELGEEEQDEFKHALTGYVRLYAFLSQVMPFHDIELEKFYTYSRYLAPSLALNPGDTRLTLDDEVALEYYRIQKISEGGIPLPGDEIGVLNPVTDAGSRTDEEQPDQLSEIIKALNERFGTDFDESDRLFFEQFVEAMLDDRELFHQAKNNSLDNFKYGVNDRFYPVAIKLKEKNFKMFKQIMDDKPFAESFIDYLSEVVYLRFNDTTRPGEAGF
ncbi:MAG: hypothetical protein GY940_27285 [bacterium]|nr:hypothetical protein [bacterium]